MRSSSLLSQAGDRVCAAASHCPVTFVTFLHLILLPVLLKQATEFVLRADAAPDAGLLPLLRLLNLSGAHLMPSLLLLFRWLPLRRLRIPWVHAAAAAVGTFKPVRCWLWMLQTTA